MGVPQASITCTITFWRVPERGQKAPRRPIHDPPDDDKQQTTNKTTNKTNNNKFLSQPDPQGARARNIVRSGASPTTLISSILAPCTQLLVFLCDLNVVDLVQFVCTVNPTMQSTDFPDLTTTSSETMLAHITKMPYPAQGWGTT